MHPEHARRTGRITLSVHVIYLRCILQEIPMDHNYASRLISSLSGYPLLFFKLMTLMANCPTSVLLCSAAWKCWSGNTMETVTIVVVSLARLAHNETCRLLGCTSCNSPLPGVPPTGLWVWGQNAVHSALIIKALVTKIVVVYLATAAWI